MVPRIIVLSRDGDAEFRWLSDGWYVKGQRGEALMTLARKQIRAGKDVPDVIRRLKMGGFDIVRQNPGYSRRTRQFVSQKISKLTHEGMRSPQRVRVAHEMARRKGFKVPKRNPDEYCYAVIDTGLIKGLPRFTVQCLPDRPLQVPSGVQIIAMRMSRRGARALADHLNKEAPLRRANAAVLRRGRRHAFFKVRRSNPTLAVMGSNPPSAAGEDIEATWAMISYRRPDDPWGKRIVRDHEFTDGFIATPLQDGSILLRHPQGHNLWTRR